MNIATFDDHRRYVMYPERIYWSGPKEGTFDAIVDDWHQNFNMRHDLLESSFNQIGIVCSCHPTFQQMCIIELGLNVVATQPIHEHPEINNGLWIAEQKKAAGI